VTKSTESRQWTSKGQSVPLHSVPHRTWPMMANFTRAVGLCLAVDRRPMRSAFYQKIKQHNGKTLSGNRGYRMQQRSVHNLGAEVLLPRRQHLSLHACREGEDCSRIGVQWATVNCLTVRVRVFRQSMEVMEKGLGTLHPYSRQFCSRRSTTTLGLPRISFWGADARVSERPASPLAMLHALPWTPPARQA